MINKGAKLVIFCMAYLACPDLTFAQNWAELKNKATEYYNAGKVDSAELYAAKSLAQAEREFGKEHPDYATSLNELALFYEFMGNFSKAEGLYVYALAIYKTALGIEHPYYAISVNNLAGLYASMRDYNKAESLYVEALAIRTSTLGKEHPDYAQSLNNLAVLYKSIGNYSKAEPLYVDALAVRKTALGTEHPDYAQSLNNLAALYDSMGNYNKAEPLFEDALAIYKTTLGTEHPDYAISLSSLAALYVEKGHYSKAEPLYEDALEIFKNVLGTEHPYYAISLASLAGLYESLGNYSKAEPLYIDALAIGKTALGTENPEYATSLTNLAGLYVEMGHYSKAEPLYVEALAIRKTAFGTEHPNYANSLHNLAGLYQAIGNFSKSETLYIEALTIRKIALGIEHRYYAITLSNLALLYLSMGDYSKAQPLFEEVLAIYKAALGTDHPEYAKSLNNLAYFFQSMGNYDEAVPLFLQAASILLKNIEKSFGFLSEEEKEKYLAGVLRTFRGYYSFFMNGRDGKPALSAETYNLELVIKGILLSSSMQMKQAIQGSGNEKAIEQYDQWNGIKSVLARQYSLPVAERKENIDSLESLANKYEKELSRLSASFRRGNLLTKSTWKNVQEKLAVNNVAIEFASFNYHNGKRWTDSIIYTALVLRKGDIYPTMVVLCRQDQLDSLLNRAGSTNSDFISGLYRGVKVLSAGSSAAGREMLYKLIWKPLEPLLRPGDHIYFSPSGLLHQVAFAAIKAEDGTLISDRYHLTQLSSTAMLLQQPPVTDRKDLTLAAFGGIRYDAGTIEMLALVAKDAPKNIVSRSLVSNGTRGSTWDYLPGTLEEINNIKGLTIKYNIPARVESGASALEEIYKSFGTGKSPKIIHIATHGFFFPDPKKLEKADGAFTNEKQQFRISDNPLNRSGLLFAGANRVWKGEAPTEGLEDGILTAYEASHVNLSNTELVALSACETGLGDIKGSEGVYGLQRAFKSAGARYLLMSLWKVPDAETAEFMTEFYSMLFSGQTIEESFNLSQMAMKKKYRDDPYKWAAFVLVR